MENKKFFVHINYKLLEMLNQQVALLWLRDRTMRLSVEILQQNIPFEKSPGPIV